MVLYLGARSVSLRECVQNYRTGAATDVSRTVSRRRTIELRLAVFVESAASERSSGAGLLNYIRVEAV